MKNRFKIWMMLLLLGIVGLGVGASTTTAEAAKKTISIYATQGPNNLYAVKSGKYIIFVGSSTNIMRYDTKSGKVSTLIKLKGSGLCLTKNGDYLYYYCDGYKGGENDRGIFRCDLSGGNVTKIADPSTFVIKNNRIFYEQLNEQTYKYSVYSMALDGSDVKKESGYKFKYTTKGKVTSSKWKLTVKGVNYYKSGPYSAKLIVKNKKTGKSSTVFSGSVDGLSCILTGDYIIYNYANIKGKHAYSNIYVQKANGKKKKKVFSGKVY